MIDTSVIPVSNVVWKGAVRIIRSLFPPIDLFEDIADPSDWALILSGEQKTNPRLVQNVGWLDLIPPGRRVGGPGASYLMAPFTHVSPDRPSRFSRGEFGVLYAARRYQTALAETIHHHTCMMLSTHQAPGWTSQFRELKLTVEAGLHDLRKGETGTSYLHPYDYTPSQELGFTLKTMGSEGIVYPSVRDPKGQCVGLFYPDLASQVVQGRHLDYHWDGSRVDLIRDAASRATFRVIHP